MVKNILVIHPTDPTTDCLCALYQDRTDCDIIRDPSTDWNTVAEAIKSHDRILCLGHGTTVGLLAYANGHRFGRYIVDIYHRPLFEGKQVWSIWCNSDGYFNTVNTKGIHTGMIISELCEEQWVLGYAPLSVLDMEVNMEIFCDAFRNNLNFDDPEESRKLILEAYVGDDEVTAYNRDRILVFGTHGRAEV